MQLRYTWIATSRILLLFHSLGLSRGESVGREGALATTPASVGKRAVLSDCEEKQRKAFVAFCRTSSTRSEEDCLCDKSVGRYLESQAAVAQCSSADGLVQWWKDTCDSDSPTAVATATPSPSSSSSSDADMGGVSMDPGTILIGVGIGFVTAILVLTAYILHMRRKKAREMQKKISLSQAEKGQAGSGQVKIFHLPPSGKRGFSFAYQSPSANSRDPRQTPVSHGHAHEHGQRKASGGSRSGGSRSGGSRSTTPRSQYQKTPPPQRPRTTPKLSLKTPTPEPIPRRPEAAAQAQGRGKSPLGQSSPSTYVPSPLTNVPSPMSGGPSPVTPASRRMPLPPIPTNQLQRNYSRRSVVPPPLPAGPIPSSFRYPPRAGVMRSNSKNRPRPKPILTGAPASTYPLLPHREEPDKEHTDRDTDSDASSTTSMDSTDQPSTILSASAHGRMSLSSEATFYRPSLDSSRRSGSHSHRSPPETAGLPPLPIGGFLGENNLSRDFVLPGSLPSTPSPRRRPELVSPANLPHTPSRASIVDPGQTTRIEESGLRTYWRPESEIEPGRA